MKKIMIIAMSTAIMFSCSKEKNVVKEDAPNEVPISSVMSTSSSVLDEYMASGTLVLADQSFEKTYSDANESELYLFYPDEGFPSHPEIETGYAEVYVFHQDKEQEYIDFATEKCNKNKEPTDLGGGATLWQCPASGTECRFVTRTNGEKGVVFCDYL